MITMVDLAVGRDAIPWYDLCDELDDAQLAACKDEWDLFTVCDEHKLPEVYRNFFLYVKNMGHDEIPQYAHWALSLSKRMSLGWPA